MVIVASIWTGTVGYRWSRPYEYMRPYNLRKNEVCFLEDTYRRKPKYKILKMSMDDYIARQGYGDNLAILKLAQHVGATKVESGQKPIAET